jgi:hypothetical protein
MIAKMKSLVDSGSQPHFSRLAPRPTPKTPPEPSAYLPWIACMLAPVGSVFVLSKNPVSRLTR